MAIPARLTTTLAALLLAVSAAPPCQASALWCAAQGDGHVAYQSDIRVLGEVPRVRLRKFNSRFTRFVNSNYSTSLLPRPGTCRVFPTLTSAERSLNALRGRLSSLGYTAVTIGAY